MSSCVPYVCSVIMLCVCFVACVLNSVFFFYRVLCIVLSIEAKLSLILGISTWLQVVKVSNVLLGMKFNLREIKRS